MPISNTTGTFSTGRDCSIVIIHPKFGRVQLDNVTGFDPKQDVIKLKSNRLDGVKMTASLPDGWSGSLMVDRGSPSLDLLMAQIEAAWIDSGTYDNATLYQFITEVGGGQTVAVYDNVSLALADAGNWQPDAITKQRLDFEANRRRI
jgi:hypothetical protein